MAEEQKITENTSEALSDSDLFTGEVRSNISNISERELFVGDEDFYRLLENSKPTADVQGSVSTESAPRGPIWYKRFSTLQKSLVAAIIVIEAMLLYTVLKPLLWPRNKIPAPTAQQTSPSALPALDDSQVVQEPLFPPIQPLSLKAAREFYLQEDYGRAYDVYDQLCQSLPSGYKAELLRDFLNFKMALCLNKAGISDQAEILFRTLSQSRSPVIRAVANYKLSLLNVQKKQFLKARTRAYQTIAMVRAVNFDKDWVLSLRRECYFLVAESMTKNILSLCDADTDIPVLAWSGPVEIDPFINLDEAELRELLISGSAHLKEGLLGPKIQKLEHQGVPSHWSVIAYGASIEELLVRFAANAGLDISWPHNNTQVAEPAGNAVRKRPVSLYLPSATDQQAVEVAAGHVGLLSSLDDKGLVTIYNPSNYTSLSEHVNLLIQETISLWRKLLITFHNDQRVPNAHFALGFLLAQKGQPINAVAEYRLVANQFSQTSLAPYALLNSSRLKAQLHDYSGAREDLIQLVEQYPESEFYGRACLNLADATKNAGFLNEAERLYRKVYSLGLSLELQIASALGAGRCSYETGDYEAAEKWLTQYLEIANERKDPDFYLAYFLMGKTSLGLGKTQKALLAFQYALSGPEQSLAREKYVETITALVETQILLENFVEALTLLENIKSWQLSKKESIEVLLLKSKVFRVMGLPDKAIVILGDVSEYLPDSQLKTRASFELVKCYIAKGNLEYARKKLTDILVGAAPGPLAHEITLELAEVCLEIGQSSQAVSVCLQLLDSTVSAQIRQKVLNVLANAYSRQKKYDDAVLALFGQW